MEKSYILDYTSHFLDFLFGLVGCYDRWRFYRLVNFNSFDMISKFPLKKLHYYVFVSLLILIIYQTLFYCNVPMPIFITSYLKDFLCIPIIATLGLHVVWFLKKDKSIRLNAFTLISLVLMYSIYFEYFLPKHSNFYVADWLDIICYSLGGLIFYILQKKD